MKLLNFSILILLSYTLSFAELPEIVELKELSEPNENQFMSDKEYANQLYKNPRGIGCYLCHGEKGEGKLIASYIHRGEARSFVAPAINSMDIKKFSLKLNKNLKGMPRYFLTQREIEILYLYVNIEKENDGEDKDAK